MESFAKGKLNKRNICSIEVVSQSHRCVGRCLAGMSQKNRCIVTTSDGKYFDRKWSGNTLISFMQRCVKVFSNKPIVLPFIHDNMILRYGVANSYDIRIVKAYRAKNYALAAQLITEKERI